MRKPMTLWPNSARWVGAVVGSGLCLALLASPAQAGEQVVAEGLIGKKVSAYGGTVAFSEQEGRDRWRLKLWRAGQVRTLAIRPERGPFDDVDLGPGEDGGLTVVYSRCRVEPRGERGCDLDLYRYSHGQERRIAGVSRRGYSEYHPSIWRSRVAFARYRNEGRGQSPESDRLYLREKGGLRSLPRGSAASAGVEDPIAGVGSLDLRGTRVAFMWAYEADECPGQRDSLPQEQESYGRDMIEPASTVRYEIWLAEREGSRRKVDRGCFGNHRAVFDPGLTDRGLFHVRSVGFLEDGLTPGPAGEPTATGTRTLVRSDSRGRTRDQRPLQPTTFGVAVGDGIIAEVREIRTPDGDRYRPRRYQLVVSD